MDFGAFDKKQLEEYAERAKAEWGSTPEWREHEARSVDRTAGEEARLGEELMALFAPFGRMSAEGADPACEAAQAQARAIQDFITAHFYTCSDEVFLQLGRSYGCGGEFTRNIDAAAGEGAAAFASRAIELGWA